jgi:hypothetical protein
MGINENWEKINEIRNKFKDKDNEIWKEKQDVFDFMMTNFEFILDQLSPEQIPFDINGAASNPFPLIYGGCGIGKSSALMLF